MMTPRDSIVVNTIAYFGSLAVSFVVTALILRLTDRTVEDDGTAHETTAVTDGANTVNTQVLGHISALNKVIFACDAGMGSSAMGVSILRTRLQKAGLHPDIDHVAVAETIARNGLPSFPGTRELLESLRDAGYRLAVASASPVSLIARNLRGLGLDGCFACTVSAQECGGIGKPEPDIFLLAAQKLDTAPAECLVVEDSANGMTAAYRAGMKWVGFDGAKVKPDMRYAVFTFADYRTVNPEQFQTWYDTFPDYRIPEERSF